MTLSIDNNEQENKSDNQVDLSDIEKKYDCVITALSQEYYSFIETVRQSDEKTNKYLVVVSIFIAGFFTVLGSPLMDNLIFQTNPLTLKSLLSFILLISLMATGFFIVKTIKSFSNSLNFVSTFRLPNLEQKLHELANKNIVGFKLYLVKCYQTAINENKNSIKEKQNKVTLTATQSHISIVLMVYTTILLFIIKYLN